MTVTVGINGFGRIGRCTLAHIAESARNDIAVVKINATGPIETRRICCAMTAFMAGLPAPSPPRAIPWIWAMAR